MKRFKKLFFIRQASFFYLVAGLVFLPLARASAPYGSGFFWQAKKEKKTFHILGTMHERLSLKDFLCSFEIIEKIKTSDWLLTEMPFTDEMGKLMISPKKEREKILSQMPPEKREEIIKIKKRLTRQVQTVFSPVYSGEGLFEDLNLKTQEFLISHGADIEGKNYADYYVSSLVIDLIKDMISKNNIDKEVLNIALSHNVPFEKLAQVSSFSFLKKSALKIDKLILDNLIIQLERPLKEVSSVATREDELVLEMHNQSDEAKFADLFSKQLSNMPLAMKQQVTINRNLLWLKQFKQAYQNENISSVFIAGGLAHFIGPYNLIDSLKEEGFAIHRLACFNGRLKAID